VRAVEVTVPRVSDKRTDPATGERKRFSSAIVPPWARKTPKITEVPARPGPGRRRRGAGLLERAGGGVPQAREGRCWSHKTANVRRALGASAHDARGQRPHLVALVRAGAVYRNGALVERSGQAAV
jgi:hypothetical protein